MKGKKIISAALAGVMALSLTACGGGSTQETTAAPAADSKAEETTAAAEGSEAATGEGVAKEDLKVGLFSSVMKTKVTQPLITRAQKKCRKH